MALQIEITIFVSSSHLLFGLCGMIGTQIFLKIVREFEFYLRRINFRKIDFYLNFMDVAFGVTHLDAGVLS